MLKSIDSSSQLSMANERLRLSLKIKYANFLGFQIEATAGDCAPDHWRETKGSSCKSSILIFQTSYVSVIDQVIKAFLNQVECDISKKYRGIGRCMAES